MLYCISSVYISFKRTVHPGDFENRGLPLDPCSLMVRSVALAFVCALPVGKSLLRRQGSSAKRLFSKSPGCTARLKEV